MPPELPLAPWHDFFVAVNAALQETVEVHCLGAFVATVLYGAPHETSDVDFLPLTEKGHAALLSEVGGKGSPIHTTHGVYLHPVGIASLPDAYEERLIEMFPSLYTKLRLFGSMRMIWRSPSSTATATAIKRTFCTSLNAFLCCQTCWSAGTATRCGLGSRMLSATTLRCDSGWK